MKKVKICHFILGFHNGGVEKVIENYFSNMDRTKFELHIVTHIPPDLKRQKVFENMGFIIHRLSYVQGHKISKKNLAEYAELFRNYKFDIVHNHFPENLLPLLFARKYKVKVRILHSHGDYENAFAKKSKLVKQIYGMGLKFNTMNATHYFACGQRAAETVFGKKNLLKGKIKIVNNAINIERFKYDIEKRLKIREELLLGDSFTLGHVGRYEDVKQKNQKLVLEIFKEVLKSIPDAKLIMLGDGEEHKKIVELSEKMGIKGNIIFTGAVPNVPDYLLAMDVFVFPSKFEGFSVATTEAQCSGLPGVMSDTISEMDILGMFDILSLNQPVSDWAAAVISKREYNRTDQSEVIREKGYDIKLEAKKLEEFYSKCV